MGPERVDAQALERQGFLLYRAKTSAHDAVCDAMQGLARSLGGHVDLVNLDSSGDSRFLPVHTEGIYRTIPLRYFMLGCVSPGLTGGNTIIYDARRAAQRIYREQPELACVSIVYASKAHNVAAEHQLVETRRLTGGPVPVLVFRDRTESNHLKTLPPGWSEESVYACIRRALSRCVIKDHVWQGGDVLVVDNHVTLHARSPFTGARRLVRLRISSADRT
jgi:alpha-ketoglutarate-dependent taurine dioxygenase